MTDIMPFMLDVGDLKDVGEDRAVTFFRQLLWAEAAKVGIGSHLIEVPGCINVGDGGIDAYIENANPSSDDVIPKGTTGFQIKSSDLGPSDCKKELHEQKSIKSPLKPEVQRILDAGGNYVLVLFADITEPTKRRREEAIRSELSRFGYGNPIRVYTITQLIGFSGHFPNLVAAIRQDMSQCFPYRVLGWAKRYKIPCDFCAGRKAKPLD